MLCCRKSERRDDISDWASATIGLLRRKVQNVEDENVSLKVRKLAQFFVGPEPRAGSGVERIDPLRFLAQFHEG